MIAGQQHPGLDRKVADIRKADTHHVTPVLSRPVAVTVQNRPLYGVTALDRARSSATAATSSVIQQAIKPIHVPSDSVVGRTDTVRGVIRTGVSKIVRDPVNSLKAYLKRP